MITMDPNKNHIELNLLPSFIMLPHNLPASLSRVNSLAPGKFDQNFRYLIFKRILVIDG